METVFKILEKVPKAKVITYKALAEAAGIKSARLIGKIIHNNPDREKYPCHRVVRSDGTLALGYAFGGKTEQEKLLIDEGVEFSEGGKIKLGDFGVTF